MSQQALRAYFSSLADRGRELLDRLPIQPQIQPIGETFAILQPAIAALRPAELQALTAIARPLVTGEGDAPTGMNSIGILADRLTILICKEWYLRHRQRQAGRAEAIRRQCDDIVACLALARPGDPELLRKVGSAEEGAPAETFVDAYFDLLAANLLMWETQELLYTRDMEAVPAEELRDYIRFFSQANLARNRTIADCERLYWAGAVG